LTCSYHLDKESGKKSGDFNLVRIENDKIVKTWQSDSYDHGFLSIKEEPDGLFSLGCSDGSVRFLSIKDNQVIESQKFLSESEG
jgi:hypothetical protein